ncbi:thioredoxin family protein [Stieleria varia]|uniref:Thioredoxin C-1 n=1 Tax=Stieleria varia TaxID=2528005 RepID=A0A5C6A472_9BACT|nr:thioredoxin family protein [Stieleria varia]TWT94712.1 Thioredoxin C-1 [Stieleria varia]
MWSHPLCALVVAVLLAFQLGCSPSADSVALSQHEGPSLPVVRGSDLKSYVAQSERPVLVEFGVDYNCPRCQQVRSDVVQLGDRLADRVDVVRIDYNTNATLVSQLGGTLCPTYVLFHDGSPVLTRSFPVSIDLLEGEIERIVEQRASVMPNGLDRS